MKTISGKKMSALLEKKGWTLFRITGSHHIFTNPGSNLRITIPIHGNCDLKVGLQRVIMKQAGVDEDEL